MISLRLARQVFASHEESPRRTTRLRLARPVSASHEDFPPHLRQLARMSSLRLRLLVHTGSFRLQLMRGPHMEVGARDLGPTHTIVSSIS
jgi:hypothetical protein